MEQKFKTIHILEAVTGKALAGTYRGFVQVITFMCRIKTPVDKISMEYFYLIHESNQNAYLESITSQHPELKDIIEESKKLKTTPAGWVDWAQNKVNSLGDELELIPCDEKSLVQVLPPQIVGNN